MQPRWSPDGTRLAWVRWDHPRMPWDGTELCIGAVSDAAGLPTVADIRVIAGDRATAIFPGATLGHDGLTTTLAFDEE